jgi:hypothetical protein
MKNYKPLGRKQEENLCQLGQGIGHSVFLFIYLFACSLVEVQTKDFQHASPALYK